MLEAEMSGPILAFRGVEKSYPTGGALERLLGSGGRFVALEKLHLEIAKGEVLGIVGESGSGKSTMAGIAAGLFRPTKGEVELNGEPLSALLRDRCGPWRRRIQMVFQDSSSALNPRKTIRRCLSETLALRGVPGATHKDEVSRLLEMVGLGSEIAFRLPHELSGGQRQRVGIARALAMGPDILIADEPVSSLDVSLQAQMINLLSRLVRDLGLTLLFISHDLALVRTLCTRIVVLQRGRVVEQGACLDVLKHPAHPYTQQLIAAVPKGLAGRRGRRAALLAGGAS
jgi:ABC-type glutathione transport system ATPase component